MRPETKIEATAGLLPPFAVGELPAPPPFSFKNGLAVIGPGTVLLAASIGSGEWLLGPAAAVREGPSILWITTVSVLLQVIFNLEAARYTLYSGEPIFTGFMRTRPGPAFWGWVYVIFAALQFGWPGWAATSASTLFAAFNSRLPGEGDAGALLFLGYLTFFLSVLVCLFGGVIERMLEWVSWFMMGFVFIFLLTVDLLYIPWPAWRETAAGFFSFGTMPESADWLLLGAFAAYSGSGGITNLVLTNRLRDKGFGMGKLVGAIPSAFGGKAISLAPHGIVFRPDRESLARWREWWRYLNFDQVWLWGLFCVIGMYLTVLMAVGIVPRGTSLSGLATGAYQAEYLAQRAWRGLWFLTLLNGFWILFSTQLAITDSFARMGADILWAGSARLRGWARGSIRRVYYTLLLFFAGWGCVAMALAPPLMLIKIGANIAGFMFTFSGIHILIVNRKLLPKELRPSLWREAALVACTLFFAFFTLMLFL